MAGLLDYIMYQQARREQEGARAQYSGLLAPYLGEQARPNVVEEGSYAGVGSPGRPLDERFYAQAAGVPGYQQLAGGLLSGTQAMQRQQQGQQFETQNMTKYQRESLDAQVADRNRAFAQQRAEWITPSGYQQAQIEQGQAGVQQGWADVATRQRNASTQAAAEARAGAKPTSGFGALQPADQLKFVQATRQIDESVKTGIDVLEFVTESSAGRRATNPAELAAYSNAWAQVGMPAMQRKFQAGAMQAHEQELFKKLSGDPGYIRQLTRTEQNIIGGVVEDLRREQRGQYAILGLQPPPEVRGQSSVATYLQSQRQGGTPQGTVTPWVPTGRGQSR